MTITSGRGLFVTFEGCDGSGKSTALDTAAEILVEHHIPFIKTREPGGTSLGEEVRAVLLTPRPEPVSSLSEALLMFGARAQHIEQVIEPALAKGVCVLCDRFTDSTKAYQGAARTEGGLSDAIEVLAQLTHPDLRPDITILTDIPVEVAAARLAADRSSVDRFEGEGLDFARRVRAEYLKMAESDERFFVVNSALPPNLVARTVAKKIVPAAERRMRNRSAEMPQTRRAPANTR